MIVEPGLSVSASAFFKSETSAAPATPATGANPHDWKIGANRATTSGDTPLIASGVAIGASIWLPAGALTACAPELPAPLTLFTKSANSREFSLNEISENEIWRACPD
ncbi:MAG: hypothetical protein JMDDDDMK_03336 [Acidobacteria bacterium]|nr:hypothetical protein [Acidobacteriota bacterium]